MHPGPLRRTVAQPCEKYFVKVAALHERIRAMRTEDMGLPHGYVTSDLACLQGSLEGCCCARPLPPRVP